MTDLQALPDVTSLLTSIDLRIADFERRYGFGSAEMLARVERGDLAPTLDVEAWSMALRVRAGLTREQIIDRAEAVASELLGCSAEEAWAQLADAAGHAGERSALIQRQDFRRNPKLFRGSPHRGANLHERMVTQRRRPALPAELAQELVVVAARHRDHALAGAVLHGRGLARLAEQAMQRKPVVLEQADSLLGVGEPVGAEGSHRDANASQRQVP